MDIDPAILEAVSQYGPFAVLFLLVMPLMGEDIIIIPAGFLIGQGHLPWWSTFFCAYIGAFISDGAWYALDERAATTGTMGGIPAVVLCKRCALSLVRALATTIPL